ncbi:hypothetical protein [Streptomyces cadmiisoli]|uniref:hypothetical protein n=1 Tax=Streptomyces cadmiisoli TaxID=2184053 RepID=UPI003D71FC5D
MTDHRIKALGTVVAAHYGRIVHEGNHTPDAAIEALEAIGRQRTAEARRAESLISTYIPNSSAEREHAGFSDVDIVDAVDYYRTPGRRTRTHPTDCAAPVCRRRSASTPSTWLRYR